MSAKVARWEPQYEITQMKGDGEAHPYLSPDDEFADYENWDVGNLDLTELKKPEMLKGEYAREALKQGLQARRKSSEINPVQVRLRRCHGQPHRPDHRRRGQLLQQVGQRRAEQDTGSIIPSSLPSLGQASRVTPWWHRATPASGPTENTRKSIFDAMVRRETYGTTGPRMMCAFLRRLGLQRTTTCVPAAHPHSRGYEKGRAHGWRS